MDTHSQEESDAMAEGEVNAGLFDSLSSYVASPRFLKAFEKRKQHHEQLKQVGAEFLCVCWLSSVRIDRVELGFDLSHSVSHTVFHTLLAHHHHTMPQQVHEEQQPSNQQQGSSSTSSSSHVPAAASSSSGTALPQRSDASASSHQVLHRAAVATAEGEGGWQDGAEGEGGVQEEGQEQEEGTPSNQQDSSSYVLVNNEDAVEAMAFYLAQCIAAHPEAQKLAPKQLQDALSNTLQVCAC